MREKLSRILTYLQYAPVLGSSFASQKPSSLRSEATSGGGLSRVILGIKIPGEGIGRLILGIGIPSESLGRPALGIGIPFEGLGRTGLGYQDTL